MSRVLTNKVATAYAVESSIGTLPGTPIWVSLEPNDISEAGATLTKVARDPISPRRSRRKGTTVDVDSAVSFTADATYASLRDFMEGMLFSVSTGTLLRSGSGYESLVADDDPASVTGSDSGYTHSALSAAIPEGYLVYARGFATLGNNGLSEVTANGTTTITPVDRVLVDETPSLAQGAQLEVCGVRGAAGDLEIDSNGDLISTTLDFTTLPLIAGQFIHVGGVLAANQFFTAANYGFARAAVIAANKITLDRTQTTFAVDDGTDTGSGGSNKQIDILFGSFTRNVATSHASYIERSYSFELVLDDLRNPAGTGDYYEYPEGNFANEVTIQLALADKATVQFGFIGTDTPVPTTSRATGASTPVTPRGTEAFSTSNDIARLRIAQVDETGITTCFKTANLTIRNNVSPEKCLGTQGAQFINFGNLEVDLEANLLLTHAEVITAIRNNETVSLDFALRNSDGGFYYDIPSMTMGDGGKNYPRNESVTIDVTCEAFDDEMYGFSLGVSGFPVLPAA